MRRLVILAMFAFVARPALGQSEDVLRAAFEGKQVRLRLEMPGSDDGVDIRPDRAVRLDFGEYAGRLKKFGVAYRPGDVVTVTKVHVKGDHIEFQLGAGGYGSFGDKTSTSVDAQTAQVSRREKELEQQIKTENDRDKKRRMTDELDRLQQDREREDARNATRAAQAQAVREETLRQRRMDGGSRFNVRYEHDVPAVALTPDALMAALAEYVEFAPSLVPVAAPAGAPGEVRKGMLVEDVDAMLGRPESISSRAEGTLTVSTSTYRVGSKTVKVEVVEGVVIRVGGQ